MTDETRNRIFEPFFTTKGPGKGTGLGSGHGLRDHPTERRSDPLETASEKGRHFAFISPLFPRRSRSRIATPRIEQGLNSETILVVEDEEVVRQSCAQFSKTPVTMSSALAVRMPHPRRRGTRRANSIDCHGRPHARNARPRTGPHPRPSPAADDIALCLGLFENDISDQGVIDRSIEVLQKPFLPKASSAACASCLTGPRPSIPSKLARL